MYMYNQCYYNSLSLSLSQYKQAFLPDPKVTNISTDWNNGIILSVLVDKLHPGLIHDHASVDPNNELENTRYAMSITEKKLALVYFRQHSMEQYGQLTFSLCLLLHVFSDIVIFVSQTGEYTIDVKQVGIHIPGSPFKDGHS